MIAMKAPTWLKALTIAVSICALLLTLQTKYDVVGAQTATNEDDYATSNSNSSSPSSTAATDAADARDAAYDSVWEGGVWVASILMQKSSRTATAEEEEVSCKCPRGCTNCAFQDGSLFKSNDNTVRTLSATDTPPKITFDPTTNKSSFSFQNERGESQELSHCPSEDALVCFSCNEGLGYFATAFSGEYAQEGITHVGSGVACIYHYTCATDGNCEEAMAIDEAYNYSGFTVIVFSVLYVLYAWFRRIPYVINIMDPVVKLDRTRIENANVPPLERAIEGYFGFGWLFQAFISSDTFIRRYTTIDEFMLMRWLRLSAKFFFISAVVITPTMWEFYKNDYEEEHASADFTASVSNLANDGTGADLKIHTLGSAKDETTYIAVTILMYLFSLLLVYMIENESKRFAMIMWKLDPKEVGIKMNSVAILNIPRYATTDPNSMAIKASLSQVATQTLDEQKSVTKDKKKMLLFRKRVLQITNLINTVVPWWLRDDGSPEIGSKYQENAANDLNLSHDVTVEESEKKEFQNLRLLTRREIEHMLRVKVEAIVGKGNIMFICVAHDLRAVNKATKAWKNARDEAIQANRRVSLIEAEKNEHPGHWKRNLKSNEHSLDNAIKERDACEVNETKKMQDLDIAKAKIIESQAPPTGAVVVLKSQALALLIANTQIDEDLGKWDSVMAPAPLSIVWHNVATPKNKRQSKTMKVRIVSLFYAVFFLVPVNFITGALNNHKSTIVDSIGGTSGETLYSVIISLIMLLFLTIAHVVSLNLSRRTGYISKNEMDVFGATIYFYVLILNLVLGNMSSRYIWLDMYDWLQEPHLFAYTFMRQLLACSTFFFKFVLLRLAQATTFELIRFPKIFSFTMNYFHYKLTAKVDPPLKKIQDWASPEETPMHRIPAVTMLIFFLGTLYAVIAPIVLPAVCAFFFILYIFFKHQLVYHYRQTHPGVGDIWSWLVGKMFFTLFFVQFVMILGVPTMGHESARFRAWLFPLPVISYLQMIKTNSILQEAMKTPLYGLFDRKDSEMKRIAFMNKEKSRKSRERRAQEARRENLAAASLRLAESRGVSEEEIGDVDHSDAQFANEAKELRPREYLEPPLLETGMLRGIFTNSSLQKFKALEKTLDTANASNDLLLEKKEWRQYLPEAVLPLARERAAMSVILKRWRENKEKRKQEK